VAERLDGFGLAYLHLIEPRVKGGETIAEAQAPVAAQELSKIFKGPVVAAGGFNPETAEASFANGDASLIAFGRHFIANPVIEARRADSQMDLARVRGKEDGCLPRRIASSDENDIAAFA
jgi:N-ethylmaleimide reductase